MNKFKYLLIMIILVMITGCKDSTMENISITTSLYPIKYVVQTLYGNHSTINSIYPDDSEVINFKVTHTLLDQYKNSDMFIFNSLNENDYLNYMIKKNSNLKIIDTTSNLNYDYSIEELWLDPNNMLTIANNIKKGFNEYINSAYLKNEVNDNYELLKEQLTLLDGNFYSNAKGTKNKSIIVSDDAFKFLEKYELNVISLDSDTATQKEIEDAKALLSNGSCSYIFIKYKEKLSDTVQSVKDETNAETKELYTMTNLEDINISKTDYITLMNQNLENIKLELYN